MACKNPSRCDSYRGWMCGPCRRKWPILAQKMDQRKAEERAERAERRGERVKNTALQAGAAALSVGGYMANPGQLPDTGQLDDSHTSQTERYRDSIEDASHGRGD